MTASSPSSPDRPLVDVRDMIVVHTAMLREFRLAPAAVRQTAVADRKHAQVVAGHLTFLCDLLHHHHHSEDQLLWPKLRARTDPSTLAVIERAEAQHEGIDAALGQVEKSRTAWAADPSISRRDQLAADLDHLHLVLSEHLDLEERALLPLAAMVLTEGEWKAIGEAGAAAVPRPAMPLVFGMFAYEGDPSVLNEMLSSAPLPVRLIIPRIAPGAYARRSKLIHGTRRP